MRPTHVYRRNAVYWWRRQIPSRLARHFARPEIKVSLRTHILPDASERAARLRVLTDAVFAELDRAMREGVQLPEAEIRAIVNELVRNELAMAERARALGPARTAAEADAAAARERQRAEALRKGLRLRRLEDVRPSLDSALERAGRQVEAGSEAYRLLQRLAAIDLIQVCRINERREQGIYDEHEPGIPTAPQTSQATPLPPAVAPSMAPPAHPAPSRVNAPRQEKQGKGPRRRLRVGAAFDGLVAEKTKDNPSWKANMGRKYVATKRLFIEAFGDIFVHEITRERVEEFRDLVRRLPESHGKSARDRREVRTIVEETDELEQKNLRDLEERLKLGGGLSIRCRELGNHGRMAGFGQAERLTYTDRPS
jgi:hypothetical protein